MSKGISAVVATILLLLITIALIGVAFMFFQRTVQTTTKAGDDQISQQTGQIGTVFSVENVDRNQVMIRNRGSSSLSGLAFYVSSQPVEYSGPSSLASGSVGTYYLNDSKLAMLPDPAELKVISAGFTDKITADFYGKYTIGYWKFDEGIGTTASDSSGNGNTGTLFNGSVVCSGATGQCPSWTAGKYGNAISFDGTNDFVRIGDKDILEMGKNDMTITAWIRTTAVGGLIVAKSWGTPYYDTYLSGNNLAGRLNVPPLITATTSGVNINDGTWHHATIVFDRDGELTVYIDGIKRGNADISSLSSAEITNAIDFAIGANCNAGCTSSGNYLSGTIDEVRILNVARSMAVS